MARPDKVAQVNAVAEHFEAAAATVLTEYSGLSVAALADLRRQLRESGAEYKVVKNTLTRLAARQAGVPVPDELLTGPTAITFCAEDPVAAAKVLKRFSRDHPGLIIKGGIVEGSLLDAEEAAKLADLASREELLARLAGMLGAVLAQPARLALANLEKAARLFAALQERKPAEAEQPAETAEAAADAEPDEEATATEAGSEAAPDEDADDAGENAEATAQAAEEAAGEAADDAGEDTGDGGGDTEEGDGDTDDAGGGTDDAKAGAE